MSDRAQLKCAASVLNATVWGATGAGNASGNGSTAAAVQAEWLLTFKWTFENIILPTELAVGFVAQCLNFVVLHRYKIRTLTYTVYLRTLCAIYLLTIPLIAFSELQKAGHFSALTPQFAFVFFTAHFKNYLINTLLFSANVITTALAAESLYGLTNPFHSMRSDGTVRSVSILSACLLLTGLVLLPVAFRKKVQGPDEFGDYCISPSVSTNFVKELSNVLVAFFESFLVLLLMAMYGALFIKYRLIMRDSREISSSCARPTATAGGKQPANQVSKHHKAIGICLGSIGAYIISNLPSALKETANLINSQTSEGGRSTYKASLAYQALATFCNMALFLNFTLIVLLQVLTSLQYRECLFRLLSCSRNRSPMATRNGHTNTNFASKHSGGASMPLLDKKASMTDPSRRIKKAGATQSFRTTEPSRRHTDATKKASVCETGPSSCSVTPRMSAPHVMLGASVLQRTADGTLQTVLDDESVV